MEKLENKQVKESTVLGGSYMFNLKLITCVYFSSTLGSLKITCGVSQLLSWAIPLHFSFGSLYVRYVSGRRAG